MQPSNVVVFVIDRWGASCLGPYGNTWSETRTFNEISAQSLLAEHAITDSTELSVAYRSFWRGVHAAEPDRPAASIISLAGNRGLSTTLLTDAAEMESLAADEPFDQKYLLPDEAATVPAPNVESTRFAKLTATALDLLATQEEPQLLWIHSDGMRGSWDAPRRLREQIADDEDPHPPTWVHPPSDILHGEIDPDELLGLAIAYAAQVRVIDNCLAPLWSQICTRRFRDATIVFASPRGYPLGEHGIVGDAAPCPYSEALHVPFMVRLPKAEHAAQRIQSIVQPVDFHATLRRVLDVESCGTGFGIPITELWKSDEPRSALALVANPSPENSIHADGLALRTPAWHYCVTEDVAGLPGKLPIDRLYAKPDDIWEFNDIADLCPDVVRKMKQAANSFREAAREGSLDRLAPPEEGLSAEHS